MKLLVSSPWACALATANISRSPLHLCTKGGSSLAQASPMAWPSPLCGHGTTDTSVSRNVCLRRASIIITSRRPPNDFSVRCIFFPKKISGGAERVGTVRGTGGMDAGLISEWVWLI